MRYLISLLFLLIGGTLCVASAFTNDTNMLMLGLLNIILYYVMNPPAVQIVNMIIAEEEEDGNV